MKIILILLYLITSNYSLAPQNQGLEIYLTNKEFPYHEEKNEGDCYCCIETKTGDLNENALLDSSDIKNFDWDRQIIYLTESGRTKLLKLDFLKPGVLPGFRAAVTLDKVPIYSLIIFPGDSAEGCDRVFTYFSKNHKYLSLKFGSKKGNQLDWKHGMDPRYDKRIKDYLDTQIKDN